MPEGTELVAVAATLPPVDRANPDVQAWLQALGLHNASDAQVRLVVNLGAKYGLDPTLRHIVLVDGKPYFTRDALLHVAHKSGVFDGIEVDAPALDAEPAPNGTRYYRTQARVFRKDFSRPFTYPGRYPATGGNARYAEEMAIKVAEVMTLRRAFDVAAPVVEEKWEDDATALDVAIPQPASLADRIAARAAELEAAGGDLQPLGGAEVLAEMEAAGDIAIIDAEPEAATEQPDEAVAATTLDTSSIAVPESSRDTAIADEVATLTLEEFSVIVAGTPKEMLRALADQVHPGAAGWRDFTPAELGRVVDLLEASEGEDAPADAQVAPDEQAAFEARFAEQSEVAQSSVATEAVSRVAPSKPDLCGVASPYGDGKTCSMDKGHSGIHRAGVSVSW